MRAHFAINVSRKGAKKEYTDNPENTQHIVMRFLLEVSSFTVNRKKCKKKGDGVNGFKDTASVCMKSRVGESEHAILNTRYWEPSCKVNGLD